MKNLKKNILKAPIILIISVLIGCLIDETNKTGASFLEAQGIVLSKKIDTVTFNLTIDSFQVAGREESHLNPSNLFIGRKGNFTSMTRLGFFIDSGLVREKDTMSIVFKFQYDTLLLQSEVTNYLSTKSTVRILAEAFILDTNQFIEKSKSFIEKTDSLELFKKLFSTESILDTLAFDLSQLIEDVAVSDTIGISLPMKNIGNMLKTKDTGKYLFIQYSILDTNTPHIMLNIQKYSYLTYGNQDSTLDTALALVTYPKTAIGMQTYLLSHPQFENNQVPMLLTGKTQGLHLYINRNDFISKLNEQLSTKINDYENEFNNQYFVSSAQLKIPLTNHSRIFDYKIDMTYEIDSLLKEKGGSQLSTTTILPLGDDSVNAGILVTKLNIAKKVDSLSLAYLFNTTSDVYNIAIIYHQFGHLNDTIPVPLNKEFEYYHSSRHTDFGVFNIYFVIYADKEKARISYHYTTNKQIEDYIGPLLPDQDSITLNARKGVQTLLNRVGPKQDLFHDFYLYPISEEGVSKSGSIINTPIFIEIPLLKKESGFEIEFTLGLYAL